MSLAYPVLPPRPRAHDRERRTSPRCVAEQRARLTSRPGVL
jgi:hypothetical protein